MHHHANHRSDWLIPGHQRVNLSREAISILSGKYKRFTFVHPVAWLRNHQQKSISQGFCSIIEDHRYADTKQLLSLFMFLPGTKKQTILKMMVIKSEVPLQIIHKMRSVSSRHSLEILNRLSFKIVSSEKIRPPVCSYNY